MSDAAPDPDDATPRAGLLAQLDAALQDGRDPDFTEILDVIGEAVTIRDRHDRIVYPTAPRWRTGRGARHRDDHRGRSAVKTAEMRSHFLAETSRVLGSSLDYEQTLRSVAWAAVPQIADCCGVDLVDERGVRERFGEDRLRALVAAQASASPADLLAALDGELRAFQVGIQADDTAVIALRAEPAPSALTGTGDRKRVVVA